MRIRTQASSMIMAYGEAIGSKSGTLETLMEYSTDTIDQIIIREKIDNHSP